MNKFEIAKQYVIATQQNQLVGQELSRVFKLLDTDNEVYYSGPIHQAYDELVYQLLGTDFYEYILRWIYELDFGRDDTRTFEEYVLDWPDSHRELGHD